MKARRRIAKCANPVVIRLLLAVIVAAITVGVVGYFTAQDTSAGGAVKVTVNSTSNTDDGECTGTPNAGTGDCTFREAINEANAGRADIINFRKSVFSKESPGVIFLDGGDDPKDDFANCLPPIEVEVTIDSTNTGVILDGDAQNDVDINDAQDCADNGREGVIQVYSSRNGFDFTLLGGKNFVIREFTGDTDCINFDGDEIIDGQDRIFGDILISGIICHEGDVSDEVDDYDMDDGIDFDDDDKVINGVFLNNNIQVDDDGIEVDASGDKGCTAGGQPGGAGGPTCDKIATSYIEVATSIILGDNDTNGSGDAVDLEFEAELNGKITANIHDNDSLASKEDDAVDFEYCDGFGCDAGDSEINVWVNDNTKLHGGEDGDDSCVEIDIQADQAPINGGSTVVDVQMNGNGLCDAGDEGYFVDIDVCCDASFSTSTVQANGNDDVIGDQDAIEVEVDLGCGDGNESTVEVNDNGSLEGQDDDGVDIDVEVGEDAGGCDLTDTESDDGLSVVEVNRNERIDGGGGEGVEVDADVGGDNDGNGDDNTNTIEVNDNGQIHGETEGIEIDAMVGSEEGEDADENTLMVTIDGNDDITGDDDEGIEIDADSGIENWLGLPRDLDDQEEQDADQNLTQVVITDNGNIEGNDDDGIEADLQAGGVDQSSTSNANVLTIMGNGEIIGRNDSAGDAIDADLDVCCDGTGTNTVLVSENGDIIGRDDDGINLDFCCAGSNIVSILDNGTIRGNDGDGIDYDVDVWSNLNADFTEPCPAECGWFQMANMLTVRGNEIFNSEEDGIEVCCGAFQFPTEGPTGGALLKSLITENEIHHNRDHGIELHSTTGFNIVENEIHTNGEDPQVDRGIEIDTDSIGDAVQGNIASDATAEDFPANHNLISQNSIYDNVGMGIELEGDTDKDGDGDHGIGCHPFAGIPSPNDCIAFPVIQTMAKTASGLKVSGDACSECHVEIFLADEDPADQLPLLPQHGEGKTYIATGTADALGDWSIIIPCGLGAGLLTATATDKEKNTSEFSRNFELLSVPCTPTPTVTNTPTNTAPPPPTNTPIVIVVTATPTTGITKPCGDVNDNGDVNSVDAQLVLQFKAALIDSLPNPDSADVDGDGQITSVDAALILQLEAGLITSLTGC